MEIVVPACKVWSQGSRIGPRREDIQEIHAKDGSTKNGKASAIHHVIGVPNDQPQSFSTLELLVMYADKPLVAYPSWG